MKPDKLVFLDIDGVLNSEIFYREKSQSERYKEVGLPLCDIDPRGIKELNKIVQETGAKIVISSTWRKGETIESIQKILDSAGFKGKVIGLTPVLQYKGSSQTVPRGCEIHHWLGKYRDKLELPWNKIVKYVIIDDDSDMLWWQRENMFIVDGYCGLTINSAYKIINFLNRK
jgi:hypothetical protein